MLKTLILDDEPAVTKTLGEMIEKVGYQPVICNEIAAAENQFRKGDVSIALVDVKLGNNSTGFDVLEKYRHLSPNLQMILMSGDKSRDFPIWAFRAGAAGYLYKPFSCEVLEHELKRVQSRREWELSRYDREAKVQQELEQRTREVLINQQHILTFEKLLIYSLCRLAEYRDPETGSHINRIAEYSRCLARHLQKKPEYRHLIDERFILRIWISAPLHDIGKAGIPDTILLKNGKLSDEEYELIKDHTIIGRQILKEVISLSGPDEELTGMLRMGMVICSSHHERWNGTGYPDGLAEDEIPLPGRIVSIVDVYDALSFPRCYRNFGFEHDAVMDYLRSLSGKNFDPAIVKAFEECSESIITIRDAHTPVGMTRDPDAKLV